MRHRAPSIVERLRSAWASDSRSAVTRRIDETRIAGQSKGSDFAERLRAAVVTRH
jgi:hypothetical protein